MFDVAGVSVSTNMVEIHRVKKEVANMCVVICLLVQSSLFQFPALSFIKCYL